MPDDEAMTRTARGRTLLLGAWSAHATDNNKATTRIATRMLMAALLFV